MDVDGDRDACGWRYGWTLDVAGGRDVLWL